MRTETASRRTLVLDLTTTSSPERRFRVFDVFDGLKVGDTLKILHSQDPRPLHYQLLLERRGEFSWESHQESQEEWVAWIKKVR